MILVVDGNQLIHTRWHIADDKGKAPDDVVEWFLTRLERLRAVITANPGAEHCRCIVAFDNETPGWRQSVLPDYKADRTRHEGLSDCIQFAQMALQNEADWQGVVASYGWESDDVIASMAHQYVGKVIIHSNDKDMHQCLVDGRVTILKTSNVNVESRALELKFVTHQDLQSGYGINANRWIDYQCMVGGKDNVRGAEGIGHKTAIKILTDHPDVPLEDMAEDYQFTAKQGVEWPYFVQRLPVLRAVNTLARRMDIPQSVKNGTSEAWREINLKDRNDRNQNETRTSKDLCKAH
jgi:5'-3' exonuclease